MPAFSIFAKMLGPSPVKSTLMRWKPPHLSYNALIAQNVGVHCGLREDFEVMQMEGVVSPFYDRENGVVFGLSQI